MLLRKFGGRTGTNLLGVFEKEIQHGGNCWITGERKTKNCDFSREHILINFNILFLMSSQHMLMSFRVSELQSLLGFAGRSKSGRKHELMGRALQMLKGEGNHAVRKKLRELYERRCGPRKVVAPLPQLRTVIPAPVPSQRPSSINSDTSGVPVHPDVRLSRLPFFEHIDDLVRPTSLGKF